MNNENNNVKHKLDAYNSWLQLVDVLRNLNLWQ